MGKRVLSAVSRLQGNNRALKEGEVGLPDFEQLAAHAPGDEAGQPDGVAGGQDDV